MATQITTKGVLTINGKQVEETVSNLKKNVRVLTTDLNKLTVGTDEWNAKLQELRQGQARLAEVQNEIRATTRVVDDAGNSFNGFYQKSGDSLRKLGSDILSGNVSWKSLGSTIKLFAAESWVAISSIPLVGWLAAIAAGIGLVVKEAMDYNKEISPQLKLLENLGLDKKILPQLRALKEAFGIETEEIADMMDNLVDSGIVKDQVKALDSLKIALAKAPNKNELISFLNSSAESGKKLGLTFEQLINIKQDLESTPMNPEKVFGAMDTFVNRVLSQSEKIQPVLEKSFGGDFSNKMYKGLIDGSLKYSDALSMIYKKGEELKISDKERADIAKALFGKSGASAYAYNEILQVISDSYKELNEDLTESQKRTLALADAYEFQAKKKDEAYNSSSLRAFMFDMKILWINAKAWFFDFISGTVNGWKLFGLNFKATFQNIPTYTKAVFKAIGLDLLNLWQMFGAGKQLLKDVFTLKWDNIDTDLNQIQNKFQNSFKNIAAAGKEIGKDFGVSGNINQNSLKQIEAENKLKADALAEIEKREKNRETPDDPNDIEKSKKKAEAARKKDEAERKKAESERKKTLEEQRKDLEESLKYEADANNRSLEAEIQYRIDKLNLQDDSYQKEKDLANLERSKELDNQRKQQDDILKTIEELEKKKSEAKSPEAKSNYEEALKKQRNLLQTHDQIVLTAEETHQLKLKTIKEVWDLKDFEDGVQQNQLEVDKRKRELQDELTAIKDLESAKNLIRKKLSDQYSENEIKNIKTLSEAKKILEDKANQEILKIQLDFLTEQKNELNKIISQIDPNSAEGKALIEKLSQFADKISDLQSQITNPRKKSKNKKVEEWTDSEKSAMQTDVLGFTAEQWQQSFDNLETMEGKLQAVGMVFQALGNAGQIYSDLISSLGQKELKKYEQLQDKKKVALKKQLSEGWITQEEYNKAIEKSEAELANKKAELEYKQAKADKISRMFGAAGNTAMAITSALAAPFPVNLTLPWIVGALGAAQLGLIAAQPLPEKPSYDQGGFTGDGFGSPDDTGHKPAGVVHAREWVAPRWMTESPRYANIIGYLESVRIGKTKPMADGGFSDSTTTNGNNNANSATPASSSEDASVMTEVRDLLKKLYEDGVIAFIGEDAKNAKKMKKMIKDLEQLENKNKH